MLHFGVTMPATVPQRSEILEGLMNYSAYIYVVHLLAWITITSLLERTGDCSKLFLKLKVLRSKCRCVFIAESLETDL
jgi:hypothetical protein